MAKAHLVLLCGLIAVAGCNRSDSQTGALTPVPAQSETVATNPPADACGAGKLGDYLGKPASDDNIAKIRAAVGHDRIRVIKPGMAVTMDYRADRLNVDVVESGTISRFYCS